MLKNILHFNKIYTQKINDEKFLSKGVYLDILRTDLMHSVVSGNKWFKLSLYLKDALDKGFNSIGTFGGAYSNHLVATAFAANQIQLNSIGIVRGEEPSHLSQTLITCKSHNMRLHFVSRKEYKDAGKIAGSFKNVYWIPEGGFGILGAEGAKEILSHANNSAQYDYIIAATGTGTMLAGLIKASSANQKVIGISVMKGNFELEQKVKSLLAVDEQRKEFEIIHDFHLGGYAKHPEELINFMNETWTVHHLPSDIVYTSKTLFAIFKMIHEGYFNKGTKILMIHSGGLQGNLSLPSETLRF